MENTKTYYWTAKNNSSFLNGCRKAKTLRGAVIAARRYVDGELCGEGKICIYDQAPVYGLEPVRIDEKSIFTQFCWKTN
jgi:hypothetical protein